MTLLRIFGTFVAASFWLVMFWALVAEALGERPQ